MGKEIEIIDGILLHYGLKCYSSGCSGQKLQIIKVENNFVADGGNNDFTLTLNWHGELILEDFHGIMNVTTLCNLLETLRLKIIELKL